MTVPPAQSPYPEQSQATTILVLGILSIVCCGLLGIAAWIMGNNELKAIDEGRRPPENRGNANAGRICGIVGVALNALGLIFFAADPRRHADDARRLRQSSMTARAHDHRLLQKQHLHWLALAPAAVLGLLTMASPSDDGPTICPMALLTGVACPGLWDEPGDCVDLPGRPGAVRDLSPVGTPGSRHRPGRAGVGRGKKIPGMEETQHGLHHRRADRCGGVVDGGVDGEAGQAELCHRFRSIHD